MKGCCYRKVVRGVFVLLIARLLLDAEGVRAAAPGDDKFGIAAEPPWVGRVVVDQTKASVGFTNESEVFLLLDYQVNVAAEATFVHVVKELRTADAVQDGSSITVDFDPEYQLLQWHSLDVVRDGKAFSQLQRDSFRLLQRESELERNLLDGSVSASVALKDVRPGDRISYSYTITGLNPVFGGRYSSSFVYGWHSRVLHERLRFLSPGNRPLRFKAVGGTAEPLRTEAGGTNEFVFDFQGMEPVQSEDRVPPWHVTHPWIDVSEFDGWADVAKWASALYPKAPLAPETEKLAVDWETRFKEPVLRLQAALDHVQQQVRYLGLELGAGSHRPTAPEVVASRRFGDCKDKAYLLCTILNRLGIPAHPLLVDTSLRRGVFQRLPSPGAFNHVVAAVRLDGRLVVVDPTASDQRGPVLERRIREYGMGLVVGSDQTALQILPGQEGKPSETDISETYTIREIGQSADLEVRTVASGSAADRMRAEFSGRRLEDVSKDYLNYYARFHQGIEAATTLRFEDDAGSNVVRVWERYRIRDFWLPAADGKHHECEVFPGVLAGEFTEPETRVRKLPLYQPHPRKVRQSISLVFPAVWNLASEKSETTNAGFSLNYRRTAQPRRMDMEFNYASLTNEIPAHQVADYLAGVKKLREALGYSLTLKKPGKAADSSSPHILLVVIGGLTFAMLLGVAVLAYRRVAFAGRGLPPDPPLDALGDEKLRGLAGWLVLIALSLCIRPVMVMKAIFETVPVMSTASWQTLTSPTGDAYHALWAPYLLFTLIGNQVLLVYGVLLGVLFFQRRRFFPKGFIVLLLVELVVSLAEIYFTRAITGEADKDVLRNMPRQLITCCVWISYMVVSRRVRLTFTR